VTNDSSSGTVAQYTINSNGTLSALSPATVAAGGDPNGVAVSPNGKYVYVANYNTSTVSIYDVGSSGALTPNSSQQTESTNIAFPSGVAVSPDGKSLYVANYASAGKIAEFSIASNGTLTPKASATIAAGNTPAFVVLTPSGRYAYVANFGSTTGPVAASISQYRVGTGGELASMGSAKPAGGGALSLAEATVSPNGKSLYAPNNGAVYQFTIGATGLLTAKSPASEPAGSGSDSIWLTANGKNAYTANYVYPTYTDSSISEYNVGSTGLLTPKTTSAISNVNGAGWVTIAPDQGPVASFTDTRAHAGNAIRFNAAASHDSDGKVVLYSWGFGDGTSGHSASATITHAYKKAGKYTVTLRVTDDSGCSNAFVFTGTTAYCNGRPAAILRRTVTIQ
jgi:6-phosphogluconolactonase (cycloisomerase 2 family)